MKKIFLLGMAIMLSAGIFAQETATKKTTRTTKVKKELTVKETDAKTDKTTKKSKAGESIAKREKTTDNRSGQSSDNQNFRNVRYKLHRICKE